MSSSSPFALKDTTLLRDKAFINGAWEGASGVIDVHNPATGEKIGTVPNMGRAETDRAIAAAAKAFPAF
jgi:succinate-semialdehyde dehydrogenase / glutarate-semialdehyde dehydrogenase